MGLLQTCVISAGRLRGREQISLSAMAIYQNTNGLAFMVPASISTACATRCCLGWPDFSQAQL